MLVQVRRYVTPLSAVCLAPSKKRTKTNKMILVDGICQRELLGMNESWTVLCAVLICKKIEDKFEGIQHENSPSPIN